MSDNRQGIARRLTSFDRQFAVLVVVSDLKIYVADPFGAKADRVGLVGLEGDGWQGLPLNWVQDLAWTVVASESQ